MFELFQEWKVGYFQDMFWQNSELTVGNFKGILTFRIVI